ncbi:LOW QUALITY PROTEIN: rho GTPase-activating protein 24 [Menidia menidia]
MDDQFVMASSLQPIAEAPRPSAIRCGWLRKQGGFVKTWHSRWFVLRGDQLHYYKDEEETKALGAIFLPGNKVMEHPTSGDEGGKFLFEVIPGGDRERMTANHETYLLMASTQNDMEDWVKTIRRVIWAPFGGGIFGQKLEETVRYERRFGNKLAPMLVEQCVDFIRQWGLREEGLFRLPGQANLVKELQDAFDCGEKPSFDSNTDVHTVASLLKLYLRELPEPVIPFQKYEEFLACAKLLAKDDETGVKELQRLVESLPPVNYNLLKYICRFLDEVQSYSGVNKMSVQNLATVFGPNILRPKMEDPVTIMEGTVLVQQLMAVLIGRHDVLFPGNGEEDSPTALELANNNNTASQNAENNNNHTHPPRQCVWEAPGSPAGRRRGQQLDNGGSPRPGSPRRRPDAARSPPLTVKKNPAFSKGSGIVTNGSFSSSPSSDSALEKSLTVVGGAPVRRGGGLKGTKMGTGGVAGGASPPGNGAGVVVPGSPGGRPAPWVQNGCVLLREAGRPRDGGAQTANQNRLSTYDNVQLNQQNLVRTASACLNGGGGGSEDKQSVDSATWSTSSCEISLPDNSTSCRSSTTTCPEQDFYGGPYEDLDGPEGGGVSGGRTSKGGGGGGGTEAVGGGGGGSRGSSSTASDASGDGYPGNGPGSHSALHSLVASLKQEMHKQKIEYEARIKSLEQRNLELETEMVSLHEELDQERKKYTMAEIKLRNAERAKDDAERRNQMLQKEMEQFFSTFSDLTAAGGAPAADPRRPDRNNPIWIQ